MKKTLIFISFSFLALLFLTVNVHAEEVYGTYRFYNPNSGEHFYTDTQSEYHKLLRAGWTYEGTGWFAPTSGDPVYRLYNPNSGDHHYTMSIGERDALIRSGWKNEGIGWYSGGKIPMYRQYNPNAKCGSHNYTTSKAENDRLVKAGWKSEGIAWYARFSGISASSEIKYPTLKEVGIERPQYTDSLNTKLDWMLNEKLNFYLKYKNIDIIKLSDYEKARLLLEYVGGEYFYADHTTAEEMIDYGGGTCFGYSDLFYCMARKMGLKNVWQCIPGRPVSHDYVMYGSLHRLCVGFINGKYYGLDPMNFTISKNNTPEEISESYAKYLLGQSNSYTTINP